MLLLGVASPQIGRPGFAGFGGLGTADGCSIDTDCVGGQTCNAATGLCEDIGSGSSGNDIGCGAGLYWNATKQQCLPVGAGSTPTTTSSGSPWWQSALSAIGVGATTALKPGATPATIVPPTPWYQSPIGIGALAIGVVGLVLLLKR